MWKILIFVFLGLVSQSYGCADTSDACEGWKASGYCTEYGDQLKELCPKSCGFCGGDGGSSGSDGVPGVAEDTRPAREPESPNLCRDTCNSNDCAWYKSQGHCSKYSAVMMMNCANTCGWCGARTCSPPKVENGWTDFEMVMIPAGAVANAFCYEGFKNYGSAQVTCNNYGELDGSANCVEAAAGLEIGEMTACQRAVEAAQEAAYMNGRYVVPQESTHYIPSCDYSGNFNQIQFDGSSGQTFCVDTFRGTEVQGTRIAGKHDYIDCTPGSAAEYYARLESEKAANADYSSDYDSGSDYSEYDYGNSGYDNTDYNYDYESSGYESTDYGSSGYESSGYESSEYENTDYGNSGYESSGYESSAYENTDYGNSGYEYENSGYESSGYDNTGYESSGYESSGYDAADFNYENVDYNYGGDYDYNYEGSGYDSSSSGYDSSGYDSSGYDTSYGGDASYEYNYNYGSDTAAYGSDLESAYYEVEGDPYYNTYYSDGEEKVEEVAESESEGGVYYAATEEEGEISEIEAAEEEIAEEAEEEVEAAEQEEDATTIKDSRRRRKMRKFRSKRSADLDEE